uniref:F-box associated domain-containing protein n=1 Tax=Oryza sativa subsp. japonica TaxID=39947 RepID=Q7XI31_ORYSJ|nr:hypothetical protein [Oryza sativa Japonica Group]BAD30208.1 hypothetical protein [Oryza sativa Japonica Group]
MATGPRRWPAGDHDDPWDVTVTLAELRGTLVVAHDDHRAGVLDLWFLLAGDGDGGKVGPQHWTKLYTVTMPYHALGLPLPWDAESAEPAVVLVDDGRVVFWVWANGSSEHGRGVIRVYDPATGGQTDVAAMVGAVHVGVGASPLLGAGSRHGGGRSSGGGGSRRGGAPSSSPPAYLLVFFTLGVERVATLCEGTIPAELVRIFASGMVRPRSSVERWPWPYMSHK